MISSKSSKNLEAKKKQRQNLPRAIIYTMKRNRNDQTLFGKKQRKKKSSG